MLCFICSTLVVALLGWIVYHFLFELPRVDTPADQTFLKGKVVWITGASSGIGEALAQYLRYQKEVKVVLSARNVTSLEAVKTELLESGVKDVLVLPLDLIALADNFALAKEKVEAVEKKFGRVDILIHNGGMSMRGDVVTTKLEVDIQVMKCNYLGAVSLTKAVLPKMIERKSGNIVAMSSVQGLLPIPIRSSYGASKHAMHAFFHSLRYELAEFNIPVTIMSPGYVKTNISLNAVTGDGKNWGKLDDTIAKGYDPSYIAGLTFSAARQGVAEVVVADLLARTGIMLKSLAPALLTQVMLKRVKKERSEPQASD